MRQTQTRHDPFAVTGLLTLLLSASTSLFAVPTLSVLPGEQMRVDLGASSVTPAADGWNINLVGENDNGVPDGVLPSGFRRWWGVQIGNLDEVNGDVLNVTVTNIEYSDNITPVWSLDGGDTYERIPSHMDLGTFSFRLDVPPGLSSIRLYKYFPYTLAQFENYRADVTASPSLIENQIGESVEGRPIYLWEITDSSVPAADKKRIWIHTAVHPSENTSYFIMEGLVTWLTSGSYEAEAMLDQLIFDIVPMANPDGVARGNYRTNANSANLEIQWGAPYNSPQPEVVAMRTKIEEFMGTPADPGESPIVFLLNLHSTHGGGYPYHFVHRPNYYVNGTGVIPAVNALENKWVHHLQTRSPLVDRGNSALSSLSGRPYVESMMHDRYTLNDLVWDPVMAITFEGTYETSLVPGVPNTDDDYRTVGQQMGLAIADYFAIDLSLPEGMDTWVLY